MEIWKDIDGYEGLYQVSNFGRVKRDNKLLHLNTNTYGYKHITLCKDGKRKTVVIHTLVANAFIDNPYKKPQINHKDGNKENNTVENLEWVTQIENNRHAINTRLKKTRSLLMFDKENKLIKKFNNRMEIEDFFGRRIYQDPITRCCNHQRKSAYGFVWRYAE